MTSRSAAPGVRLVLASASPARLQTLRAAGIEPIVEVSGVDESAVDASDPAELAGSLARLKGETVAARLSGSGRAAAHLLVLGCDSVLDVDGVAHGKPATPRRAVERLRALRGRSAVLRTGHHLSDLASGRSVLAVASTTVWFGDLGDEEIDAYVGTGEPLQVAGAFTIDGLGGAFVDRVDGDPHNVVGVSLPLLRRLTGELGFDWHRLWTGRLESDAALG